MRPAASFALCVSVAVALAAASAARPVTSPGSPLYFLRTSGSTYGIFDLYRRDGGATPHLLASRVYGAALTAGGTIFVTRPSSSSPNLQSCDLFTLSPARLALAWSSVAATVNRAEGLCTVASDGRGGVFFSASNGTAGSFDLWDFDPASGKVSHAAYGDSPSASRGGHYFSVLAHQYYSAGGSYDMPYVLRPGQPEHAGLVPVPATNSADFVATALTPTANGIALATYDNGAEFVVLGRLTASGGNRHLAGALHLLERLPTGQFVRQLYYADDGQLMALLGTDVARNVTLYRFPSDGSAPKRVAGDIAEVVPPR